jgi:hypothetical protein
MSIFTFYFATQLMGEAGWPRKLGMFKGVGYDTLLADAALAQSIDWGAGLGAGRPGRALQMIAEMYRDRDWHGTGEGTDPPNFEAFVESTQETWSRAASPREAVRPVPLAKSWHKSTITVEELKDPRLMVPAEQLLLQALLWGLSYPESFNAWFSKDVTNRESIATMLAAGVEVGQPPTLEQYFEAGEQIVLDYERDIGPLPLIPPKLVADAQDLGWRIKVRPTRREILDDGPTDTGEQTIKTTTVEGGVIKLVRAAKGDMVEYHVFFDSDELFAAFGSADTLGQAERLFDWAVLEHAKIMSGAAHE